MILADRIEAVLAERGPLPACTLAGEVRKRRTDVLAALHSDARFQHQGRRRGSRWSLSPNGNGTAHCRSVPELAELLNRSDEWTLALLEESERGGVVERVNGGWRLSEAGESRYGRALRALALGRDAL